MCGVRKGVDTDAAGAFHDVDGIATDFNLPRERDGPGAQELSRTGKALYTLIQRIGYVNCPVESSRYSRRKVELTKSIAFRSKVRKNGAIPL